MKNLFANSNWKIRVSRAASLLVLALLLGSLTGCGLFGVGGNVLTH